MLTASFLIGFSVAVSFVSSCFVDKYNISGTVEYTLYLPERLPQGYLVENISLTDNITLSAIGKFPPFIVAQEGNLYTNETVDLDNNKEWCEKSWIVIVTCASDNSRQIFIIIAVTLTDDFDPEINGSHSFEVFELTSLNTELFDLNSLNDDVTDRDCNSDSNILYDLVEVVPGGEMNAFAIENKKIYATRILDFDLGDTMFILNISVTQTVASRKGYELLTVTVINIDDMNPIFNTSDYFIDVMEENSSTVNVWERTSPPIAAYDQDRSSNDTLTFSLFDPNDAQHLEINAITGEVRLNHTFDREKNDTVKIVIKVQQTTLPQRSALATVTIRVTDINDNPPVFQEASYKSTSLAEHSPDDTIILFVSAIDSDLGDNAIFNYSLESYADVFNINTMTIGQNRLGILTVKNSSKLDREEFKQFTIEVGTKEEKPTTGSNCRDVLCTTNVTIILKDINDNSPEFQGINYTYFVTNTAINALITEFNATDADEGDNAKVVYTITSYDSSGKGGCDFVKLDNATGALTLTNNASTKEDCTWRITACDSPVLSERRCTSHPVKILFPSNVVVNGSVISINFPENQPAGSLILQLEVQGGVITSGADKFKLDKDVLKTRDALDRESSNNFTVLITFNDLNRTVITVNITVTDVNDNNPVFVSLNDTYIVRNATTSASLFTNAGQMASFPFYDPTTDADEFENALLSYELIPSADSENKNCTFVTVRNDSGEVWLKNNITDKVCSFLIQACDNPADSSQRRCTSHLTTIVFPIGVTNGTTLDASVTENLPSGSIVLQLPKYAENITLDYDNFVLSNRLLTTKVPLDRENQSHYHLSIPLGDEDRTTIFVNITVLDVNDNSPEFDDSTNTYPVTDIKTGVIIAIINASDADLDNNANLLYELVPFRASGNGGCDFITIENTTGTLKLANATAVNEDCLIMVQSCDNPENLSQRRCTSRLIKVTFPNDVNGTTFNISIAENLLSGSIVLRLPKSGELFHNFDDRFQVQDGLLTTKGLIDRENQSFHHLALTFKDQDNTTIFVYITVVDINDNSPEFVDFNDTYIINDTTVKPSVTIRATDRDEGDNAEIEYKIISQGASRSSNCDVVTIDGVSGEISLTNSTFFPDKCSVLVEVCDNSSDAPQRRCTSRLTTIVFPIGVTNGTTLDASVTENLPNGSIVLQLPKYAENIEKDFDSFVLTNRLLMTKVPLDRENQSHYHLSIPLGDKDDTTIFVNITIVDVNDNSPEFGDLINTYLVTDMMPGASIATINASDTDLGNNANLLYELIPFSASGNGDCDFITIENTTGTLKLANATTLKEDCLIMVQACDSPENLSQRRCASRLIKVTFPSDVNGTTFNVTIAENLPSGSIVLRLPKSGELIPYLDDRFEVKDGLLTTKGLIDRENQSFHHLALTFDDQENTTIFVDITVIDVNDNSPEFVDFNNTYIVNDTTNGHLATVRATDRDEGDNAEIEYKIISQGASRSSNCDAVAIDGVLGEISLTNNTFFPGYCSALVEACDNSSDVSQRRCTSRLIQFIFQADVTINVTSFNVNLAENVPSGSIVLQLPKDGKYFQLYDDHFLITNGLLVTNALFDRENQSFYPLTIYGDELNRTTFALNITLTDVNDNAPEFLNSTMYTVNLNKTLAGQVIAEVRAKDIDEGVNAEILYSLEPSSVRNFFSINSTLGKITVTRLPDVDADEMDLIIVASDGGTPSLKSTSVLKVRLLVKSGIVRLTVPASTARLESDKTNINKQLDNILGVTVTIENITRAHSEDRSFLQISGKNSTTKESIPKNILQEMVDVHGKEIDDLFAGYLPVKSSPLENEDLSIALIVIGSVFLIGLIICIIVIVRRRRHERYQKRDSVTSSSISDVEEGMTVLKNLDQDLQGDEIGVVNPAYSDGDAVSVNSASHSLVSVITTVETSAIADETIENETGSRHESMPDADSGVPSDREGGGGDSDSDSEPDGEESAERDPNYLAAVLMASNAKSPDANVDGRPPEPPVDFVEEQKLSPLTPIDDDESNYTKQLLVNSGDDDDYLDTADKPFLRLMSARPPTPPMKHQPKTKEEEEEEAAMPSEPLPDYGKKVRFNFKVTEHLLTDFAEGQTDDDGLGETGSETNNNEKPKAGLSSTRSNEDKDLSAREIVIVNDTETNAFLSPEEEVTSL